MSYLGIDIGTTGAKICLFSDDMKMLARFQKDYVTHLSEDGICAEHDPQDWLEAVREGIAFVLTESGREGSDIAGIGLSCMTPVLLALDAEGRLLTNAWLWYDRRGSGRLEEIEKTISREEWYSITGSVCKPISFLNKLLEYKEHYSSLYQKTKWFLQASGYLAYVLTGVAGLDSSHGEILFLVDKETGNYSERVFDAFGLDRSKFPPIHPVTRPVGSLKADFAGQFGLRAGIPVFSGGHDSALSALAMGVTSPGDACLDIGNAANLVMCTDRAVRCSASDLYRHPLEGRWLFQIYSSTIGASFRWFRKLFAQQEETEALQEGVSVYDLLVRQAAKAPAGAGGVLFLPYLQGAQQNQYAKGAFLNITLQTGRNEMIRALLEGCAYSVRYNCEQMEAAAGKCMGPIQVCGGGAGNRTWLQIYADVLQKELHVSSVKEGACTGTALLVKQYLKSTGEMPEEEETDTMAIVSPNPEMKIIYDEMYLAFKKAFEEQ